MADDSDQVGQDEIEALLRQAQSGDSDASEIPPPKPETPDDTQVDQAEIEALLNGGATPETTVAQTQAPPTAPQAAGPTDASPVSSSDIELLLNKAEQALESIDQDESLTAMPPGMRTFDFQKFGGTAANTESTTLELMRDVQLDMTIELGRTHMHLEEILKLKQGAVVTLDKLAGDPADIYVNGRLVARGEVLVLNDNFCIRVAELIEGENAVA